MRDTCIFVLFKQTNCSEGTTTNLLRVRSACEDILTFVDKRWCALKVVSSTVINDLKSFTVRWRTFPYVVVRTVCRRLLCMYKKVRRSPTNCQFAEASFTRRNANCLCVGRTLTARYWTQFERFVLPQSDNDNWLVWIRSLFTERTQRVRTTR